MQTKIFSFSFKDVRMDQLSAEGYKFYEQINIEAGCIKIGRLLFSCLEMQRLVQY